MRIMPKVYSFLLFRLRYTSAVRGNVHHPPHQWEHITLRDRQGASAQNARQQAGLRQQFRLWHVPHIEAPSTHRVLWVDLSSFVFGKSC